MADLYFGGSFNPIHNAHLACSTAAAVSGSFESVVLVPTGQSALKSANHFAPATDRFEMAGIAAREWAGPVPIRVSGIEVLRSGPSYTADTAAGLRARGATRVDWLIGADQLLHLHRWHAYPRLLTLVQFWVMARPGHAIDWDRVDPSARGLSDFVLPAPLIEISSTMIREHVRRGYAVDEWVPPGVAAYIREHSLYSPSNNAPPARIHAADRPPEE